MSGFARHRQVTHTFSCAAPTRPHHKYVAGLLLKTESIEAAEQRDLDVLLVALTAVAMLHRRPMGEELSRQRYKWWQMARWTGLVRDVRIGFYEEEEDE